MDTQRNYCVSQDYLTYVGSLSNLPPNPPHLELPAWSPGRFTAIGAWTPNGLSIAATAVTVAHWRVIARTKMVRYCIFVAFRGLVKVDERIYVGYVIYARYLSRLGATQTSKVTFRHWHSWVDVRVKCLKIPKRMTQIGSGRNGWSNEKNDSSWTPC